MSKSTAKSTHGKPAKPYDDFPLFPHATRRWAKKIRGRLEYFGSWEDGWQKALENYQAWKDDLYAGRRPSKQTGKLTIRDLCNAFRESKEGKVETGELKRETLNDYLESIDRIIRVLGKTIAVEDLRPGDFAKLRADIAKHRKTPEGLGNEINSCRVIFNFAVKNHLVNKVWFGDDFRRPARAVIRRARAQRRQAEGEMMFEANELTTLLGTASGQYKAMILLAINCGLDGASIGQLPKSAIDLERKWLNFPRYKTGNERQCPLWPETVSALRESLEQSPPPKPGHEHLVFLTRCGTGWHKGKSSTLSHEFRKLLEDAGMYRKSRGFRALRHTFETVAGESRDQVAVDHIMGHEANTMAAVYRERIAPERLQAVVDHVHNWLWPPKPPKKQQQTKKSTKRAKASK